MKHLIRLTHDEIATILAALQFWSEEIIPYGDSFARPYLDAVKYHETQPVSERDVQNLQTRLQDIFKKQ